MEINLPEFLQKHKYFQFELGARDLGTLQVGVLAINAQVKKRSLGPWTLEEIVGQDLPAIVSKGYRRQKMSKIACISQNCVLNKIGVCLLFCSQQSCFLQ